MNSQSVEGTEMGGKKGFDPVWCENSVQQEGHSLVGIVLDILEHGAAPPHRVVFTQEHVIRQSCGALRMEAPEHAIAPTLSPAMRSTGSTVA